MTKYNCIALLGSFLSTFRDESWTAQSLTFITAGDQQNKHMSGISHTKSLPCLSWGSCVYGPSFSLLWVWTRAHGNRLLFSVVLWCWNQSSGVAVFALITFPPQRSALNYKSNTGLLFSDIAVRRGLVNAVILGEHYLVLLCVWYQGSEFQNVLKTDSLWC